MGTGLSVRDVGTETWKQRGAKQHGGLTEEAAGRSSGTRVLPDTAMSPLWMELLGQIYSMVTVNQHMWFRGGCERFRYREYFGEKVKDC